MAEDSASIDDAENHHDAYEHRELAAGTLEPRRIPDEKSLRAEVRSRYGAALAAVLNNPRRRVSQAELGRLVGKSQAQVSEWVRGAAGVTIEQMVVIDVALRLPLGRLLSEVLADIEGDLERDGVWDAQGVREAADENVECVACGRNPAQGFAMIGGDRYCHGDEDESPTCYEQEQSMQAAVDRQLATAAMMEDDGDE